MEKLRLVITEDCNRSCPGCCMNPPPEVPRPILQQDLDNHPSKEVYVTGGEPFMVGQYQLTRVCSELKESKKVFLYSAWTGSVKSWEMTLPYVDGVTFTLHERSDFGFFFKLSEAVNSYLKETGRTLSLWLNVFDFSERELKGMRLMFDKWVVRQKEWVVDCPVPEGEDFRKLVW